MKKFGILFIIFLVLCGSVFSQDNKSEAQKLYLKASALIRQENYSEAKLILEEILNKYSDTDIALDADKKLNEITGLIKKENLPKIPGVYAKLKSNEFIKLDKEVLLKAGLAKPGATNLYDLLDAPSVNYILFETYNILAFDEVVSIIVYNPNLTDVSKIMLCSTDFIKNGSRTWIDEPSSSKGKSKYVLISDWKCNTIDNQTIKSDELIKSKIGEGMFEIKFVENKIPSCDKFILDDGLGYAYPIILMPSKVIFLKDKYINLWDISENGANEIDIAIKNQPQNIELFKIRAIYEFRKNNYDKAIEYSKIGLKKDSTKKEFETIIKFSNTFKVLINNKFDYTLSPDEMTSKISFYEEQIQLNHYSYEPNYYLFYIYFSTKNWDKAETYLRKSIELFDKVYSDNTISLLYAYKYIPKKHFNDYNDQLESYINLIAQERHLVDIIARYLDENENIEEGITKCLELKKLFKTNEHYYEVLSNLYYKANKIKEAKKMAKEALECAEKNKSTKISYYQDLLKKFD